jgi:hypothetical protein
MLLVLDTTTITGSISRNFWVAGCPQGMDITMHPQ